MLVVKIELWRKGDPNNVEELGRTFIWNDGGTDERGNYKVAVLRKGYDPSTALGPGSARKSIARLGEVNNYPRLAYNVWRLVIRALKSAFPEEK